MKILGIMSKFNFHNFPKTYFYCFNKKGNLNSISYEEQLNANYLPRRIFGPFCKIPDGMQIADGEHNLHPPAVKPLFVT